MTAIQIERYGDFDMINTICIMICDDNRDVKTINNNFCDINGIPKNGDIPDIFIDDYKKFLKKEGFRELKTKKIRFTDEY